jgi:type II secretory pathway pseudopilin PulG
VSAFAIVVIVVVGVLVLLFVGGLIANGRRARAEDPQLRANLREADQALARARAEDRGWDRGALEAAARTAFAARSPVEPRELQLVKVVDRPGIEHDQCLFRVVTDVGSEEILLVRTDGAWGPAPAPPA